MSRDGDARGPVFEGVTLGERYQVYGRIGGSALVARYDGIDTLLARPVDIVALTPQAASDPDLRDRFQNLGRLAATRTHPHIVDVYDIDVFNGLPFVVTEHLSGETLRAIIKSEAPFHPDDVVALTQQLAPAADSEVTRGAGGAMVSADTVLVDASGVARHSDFLTFGAHHAADGNGWSASWPAQPPPGPVAAIATIAYQLLTGESPERVEQHIAPPSEINAAATPDIDRIVIRGLDPRLRDFPSAVAFSTALAAAARRAQQVRAARTGGSPEPRRPTPTLVSPTEPITVARQPLLTRQTEADEDAAEPEPPRLVAAPAASRRFPWTGIVIVVLSALVIALAAARYFDSRGNNSPANVADTATQAASGPTATSANTVAGRVPSLVGMTRDAAAALLAQQGLVLQESAPAFSDTIATGAVVAQDPAPGAAIPANRTVTINVSKGPSSIDLASLSLPGMAEADARQELETRGLTVQTQEAGSTSVPAGQVIAVQPNGVVKTGATVTLAVSAGDKVQISRDIFSMPLQEAETKLREAGIRVAGTIKVGPSALAGRIDTTKYKIVSGDVVGVQNDTGDAAFGAWIARDSSVTLVYFDSSS